MYASSLAGTFEHVSNNVEPSKLLDSTASLKRDVSFFLLDWRLGCYILPSFVPNKLKLA